MSITAGARLLVAALFTLVAEGGRAQSCPGDLNGDGAVTIDEIIVVVNASLNDCSTPTPPAPASATPTPRPTRTSTRTPTATGHFIDNGNGTITDTSTQLTWAKQSDDGRVTDMNGVYTWTATYPDNRPTGTLFSVYLASLNAARFGGHSDWRIPTESELRSILDPSAASPPLVAAPFNTNCRPGCSVTQCSCTAPNSYWTATLADQTPGQATYVSFQSGRSGSTFQTDSLYGRAVRGGP